MRFTFDAELFPWHSDKTTWVFVALPKDIADEVEETAPTKGGFGSVKVEVQLGDSQWSTSVFPSKEFESYILPVKKSIRKAEGVNEGDTATFTIDVVQT